MTFQYTRKKSLTLLLLVIAVAVLAVKCVADKVNAKPSVRVTISKETTYITEPLRSDGYPDYVAALNQRFSEGVTPENNAAVLFWKAVGPGAIGKKCREKYFQMLGIPPPPEKGGYFVTSYAHVNAHIASQENQVQPAGKRPDDQLREKLRKQLDSAMKRPWSKQEFPLWAEWLAANEKPLALMVEASKRPRRYDPLICGEKAPLIAVLLQAVQSYRNVAWALVAHAMLHARDDKLDEAWQDLLTCHRLARLVGQGTMVVEGLVAITIDGIALIGDQALLQHAKLTSDQIAKMRKDFAKLPPMPKMVDKLDVFERFAFLDCVAMMAREGRGSVAELTGGGNRKGLFESLMEPVGMAVADWDVVLHTGNSWYDRIADACRKPTRTERKKAMDKICKDTKNLSASARDLKSFGWSLLGGPRKAVSERIGQILVALFVPGLFACPDAEDRWTMQFELTKLAFVLAQYRADHGLYPEKLAELVPKYVAAVPKDIFNNDGDLHYSRQGDGYLLYSVGVNGKDDGGKGYADRKAGETCDDLVVRVPAAQRFLIPNP